MMQPNCAWFEGGREVHVCDLDRLWVFQIAPQQCCTRNADVTRWSLQQRVAAVGVVGVACRIGFTFPVEDMLCFHSVQRRSALFQRGVGGFGLGRKSQCSGDGQNRFWCTL